MRITDLLAPLGLVVIIAAKAVELNGHLPGQFWYYLAGGLALMALHAVLRWDDIVAGLGARQMMYGGNLAVLTLAVLGILGLLNYLASRNSKRWDLTKSQRFSLSDQTRKMVAGLKDDVTVYSGASIMGGDTVIGAGSIIGANVWLTQSVPAGSKIFGRSRT